MTQITGTDEDLLELNVQNIAIAKAKLGTRRDPDFIFIGQKQLFDLHKMQLKDFSPNVIPLQEIIDRVTGKSKNTISFMGIKLILTQVHSLLALGYDIPETIQQNSLTIDNGVF